MQLNEQYWLIKSDAESESYGDKDPREPWCGRITQIREDVAKVCSVAEDGTVDDDTNASCWVYQSDLYPTEQSAQIAYEIAIRQKIKDLASEIIGWVNKLSKEQQ